MDKLRWKIRIGNVKSLFGSGVFNELRREYNTFPFDLMSLQEVRCPGVGMLKKQDCILWYKFQWRQILGVESSSEQSTVNLR